MFHHLDINFSKFSQESSQILSAHNLFYTKSQGIFPGYIHVQQVFNVDNHLRKFSTTLNIMLFSFTILNYPHENIIILISASHGVIILWWSWSLPPVSMATMCMDMDRYVVQTSVLHKQLFYEHKISNVVD